MESISHLGKMARTSAKSENPNEISDHLPTFSLLLYNNSTIDKDKYVFFREKMHLM